MGRADQLFGVGAFAIFKPSVEAVGLCVENFCLGGNITFALFKVAFPMGGA